MIVIIFLLSLFVNASSMDPIMESSSIENLISLDQKNIEKNRLIEKCSNEKKQKIFPKSCFQKIVLFIDMNMEKENWMFQKKKLNSLCEIRAETIGSLLDLAEVKKTPILSPHCQKALLEREQDLLYIHDKENWSKY